MTTWTIDPQHGEVAFAVRHMMVATVRGRFRQYEADLEIDPQRPQASSVVARIDVASISTGDEQRDAHLRSADFFDAERYPQIGFRSRRIEPRGKDRFTVTGDLTIRDVTREVVLNGSFVGPVKDPYGHQRAGFTLEGEVDREAFGLTWNVALETGGVLVGKTVKLHIELEAIEASEAAEQNEAA